MRKKIAVLAACMMVAAAQANAEIVVGVNLSLSGPAAALGISLQRGLEYGPKEIGGEPVRYIVLDDASDPSAAVRNVRKLIDEERADIIIGPTNAPAGYAIAPVIAELEVPLISTTPIELYNDDAYWFGTVLMDNYAWVGAIVNDIKAQGHERIAYLGYSDTFGDIVHDTLSELATQAGIEVVANERFARSDTSVTGQVLRIIGANPDAVVVGASASPAALPNTTLVERNLGKPIYNTPAAVGQDFLRLVGGNTQGVYAASFLITAARMLPDDHPVKELSIAFIDEFEAQHGVGTADGQVGEGYDASLVLTRIAEEALKAARPGTQEFRAALRDELYTTKDLVGTLGLYTFNQGNPYGLDERSIILLGIEDGGWVLKE